MDKFRRTLPLITDLKNPAMRSRHWTRVKATVDRDFDETSKEFTLELIAEMQLQNFADEISEISNAATMELAIETVSKLPLILTNCSLLIASVTVTASITYLAVSDSKGHLNCFEHQIPLGLSLQS